MIKRTGILFALLFTVATAHAADEMTEVLLARSWPLASTAKLTEIGRGVGIIFSPDLSVPGNCRFYETLGFACFDSPDWQVVVDGIRDYNTANPDAPIRTLILETHGTNGNGLKLQKSKADNSPRSYISVGGLQERVEPEGVRYILIAACNSGRLLRPAIYRNLDPNNGDKLFAPATLGIYGASEEWRPERSRIMVITPASSRIETNLVGYIGELAPPTRKALTRRSKELGFKPPVEFAVSDLLIQILTRDSRLQLVRGTHVEHLSKDISPASMSERLFDRFVAHLDTVAARELPKPAKKSAATPRTASR